jgi:hypothetical protein
MLQAHIARRVDSRIAGSQEVVDTDSGAGIVPNAGSLQIDVIDIGVGLILPSKVVVGNTENYGV